MPTGIPINPHLMNLQSTLSAASSGSDLPFGVPHHPITCAGPLAFFQDGTLSCEHAQVGPDDIRTQCVLDHTIAILLLELAGKTLGQSLD